MGPGDDGSALRRVRQRLEYPLPFNAAIAIHLLDPARRDGAAEVLARTAERRILAAGSALPGPGHLLDLATQRLARALEDPRRRTFLATDAGGQVQAILGGILTHLRPEDVEHTYMAPDHVLCPIGAWAARDEDAAAEHLPDLLAALRTAAAEDGIDRVNVQVLDAEWWSMAVWMAAGLRPDSVYGLRPLAAELPASAGAPRVALRLAEAGDLDALVRLSDQEHRHHALRTGTGLALHQSPETVRRVAAGWLDGGEAESALVAVGPDGQVVGTTTTQVISLQADVVATVTPSLPARYGYIGMSCVDERHRGLGIGGALLRGALERLRALPDPPRVVGLHYVADNPLAAPFWSSRGFAAALTLLTTAPAGPPGANAHGAQ